MATYKQADYEALRRRCVELKHTGWKQAATARAFGLTEGWVSQTLKTHREQHGFSGQVWTRPRVNEPSRRSGDYQALWVVRHRGSVTILPRSEDCSRRWDGVTRSKLASRTRRLSLTGERSGYQPLKKAKAEGRTILYVDD